MRSPIAELLAGLATAFDEVGAEWYLFGAQAAVLHGVARLTADVDVTVRLPAQLAAETLAQSLERHGFDRRFTDPRFIERTRVIPFIHCATALPVDLVLAGPGLEDQFFERAALYDVDGIAVPLASAEDLIVMKVLAGRNKDLDDVAAIAGNRVATLGVAYIDDTLRALEQALGQSDLVVVFETIWSRVSQRSS